MQTFVDWMEEHFAPLMNKVNRNVWILTLKDSIMQTLPMVFVGSLLTVVAILQDFIPNFPNLWTLQGYSMGLISLFIAFLIPFNYAEKKKIPKVRLVGAMTGVALFAIVTRLQDLENFDYSYFGAGGMFVALIVGVFAAIVMSFFGNFSFFKEDSPIPDFVRSWFDTMLPVTITLAIGWFFVYILNIDLYNVILNIFAPIERFSQSYPGFVLMYFSWVFIYSMGISTWVLTPITRPILLGAIAANSAAVLAGLAPTNITTNEVIFSGWVAIGGIGTTLPLVILLMTSRSKRLKALGTASFVPGILNINEPVIFGCVAWNPVLMVASWLQGIIIPMIVYPVLKMGLVPIPYEVFDLWYCPFPIATWLVSKNLMGLVLFAVVVAVSFLLWYPFFKVYEKQQLAVEAAGGDDED